MEKDSLSERSENPSSEVLSYELLVIMLLPYCDMQSELRLEDWKD